MSPSSILAFKQQFSGEIVAPDDDTYEQARSTYMAKGTPVLVVRPSTALDVAAAIKYARDNSLILSVRSGGHSVIGFGTNDGGIVIDLSRMDTVELIDSDKHTVRVGGGAKWGEVAEALQGHGLVLSSGDTRTVGVGGLTLGGGIGWMVRKYGLAIDSLVAAEVVTANGEVVRASANEHSDLFWAIRGGGGNFGVVTYFEFAAHPLGQVYFGTITYGLDNLAELLKGWRDYMRTASEDLSTSVTVMPSFGDNPPAALVMFCYASDDEAAAMQAIEPLKQFGSVVDEDIQKKDYSDVLEDAHPPAGVEVIVKNLCAENLSDELIDTIAAATGKGVIQIRSLGGAVKRVPADATAFHHRNSEIMMFSGTFVAPGTSESDIAAAMKPWEKIAAFGSRAYANFISTNTENDVADIYPPATYQRLAAVKKIYDPDNIFNQNFNILPAK